jgi:hypothetical protein
MFRAMMSAILLLPALAACGEESSAPANVTKITGPKENAFQQKMLALPETSRNLTLRRAIQDDGGSCPRITDGAYQQEYKGMAMWVARCSNRDWAVYLGPTGNVQARACNQAAQLKLPECSRLPPRS